MSTKGSKALKFLWLTVFIFNAATLGCAWLALWNWFIVFAVVVLSCGLWILLKCRGMENELNVVSHALQTVRTQNLDLIDATKDIGVSQDLLKNNIDRVVKYTEQSVTDIGDRIAKIFAMAQVQLNDSKEIDKHFLETEKKGIDTSPTLSKALKDTQALLNQIVQMLTENLMVNIGYSDSMASIVNNVKKIYVDIQLIQSIASQTRYLAINASIEAARAGQLGAGFSIVADQVRILSENSRKAAEKISSSVGHVKSEVDLVSANLATHNAVTESSRSGVSKSVEELVMSIESSRLIFKNLASASVQNSKNVVSNIDGIVASLQFQDLTRQQLEGVYARLNPLFTRCLEVSEKSEEEFNDLNIDSSYFRGSVFHDAPSHGHEMNAAGQPYSLDQHNKSYGEVIALRDTAEKSDMKESSASENKEKNADAGSMTMF